MPDLLVELFSEEIPARMQARAAADLKKLVTDGLVDAGLTYEGAAGFATPRRLALNVVGVPVSSPDTREERKGPRVDAPEKAIQGFLRGAGLASIDEAEVRTDPRKGDFYVAVIARPGRPAHELIAEIVPRVIRDFPWPKSMRWGAGTLRWVRPLQSILCVFGPETEDTDVVAFEIDGLRSGRQTRGHRFMAPEPIAVRRFDDYVKSLEAAKVVLDAERRREMIRADAANLAFAQGFEVVDDEGLLEEVAGLVEWPVVLMGEFDAGFLDLPPEVVRLTIRNNQKCFVLRDRASGQLAHRFLLVANVEAEDGGARIVAGNERVITARLADARFFWEQDRKKPLEAHADKLADITFHEKLGTLGERVERIARLARELAPVAGADPDKAERAARLCKADLVSEMVGEFPELQGVMGRYYAEAENLDPEIAAAIGDHYRPVGQGDAVPTAPVSIAVALADKLDMLVGFWAIDEKPTGSKDPYALRRAALGVIRIVMENELRLGLSSPTSAAYAGLLAQFGDHFNLFAPDDPDLYQVVATYVAKHHPFDPDGTYLVLFGPPRNPFEGAEEFFVLYGESGDGHSAPALVPTGNELAADLLDFFADRLKVQLREEGARHDLVDAVFALGQEARSGDAATGTGNQAARSAGGATGTGNQSARSAGGATGPQANDDLLMIVRRVEALGDFLSTDDGASLLTAYRRAANILRIEEKKDGRQYAGHADPARFAGDDERVLFDRIAEVTAEADSALGREDFAATMAALARLRGPVDTFFDTVTVNAEDPALRENRLLLLSQIRAAMDRVADFSKIGG